ncbi:tetratricopeptide repeat protein 1-like isoform X2 [Ornithodoros turicata]|uniref:tetratricopeptide repeat protein 1-like isoform X2 n=1 Tax=Ornithodoros turicata TaxID=34597 RepID=UPI00313995FC
MDATSERLISCGSSTTLLKYLVRTPPDQLGHTRQTKNRSHAPIVFCSSKIGTHDVRTRANSPAEQSALMDHCKEGCENPEEGDPARDSQSEEDSYERLAELEKSMTQDEIEERRKKARQLKEDGNGMFKNGQFQEASDAYTQAIRLCTLDAAIIYSNRAAARSRLDQKEAAIEDCTRAIELDPCYIKAILRRAHLYEETEKLDEALADYKLVLELDPSIQEARRACVVLPDKINERNERLKTEMIGKLKELGNLVLNPFGMSTDNFKFVKNEESGGYSVQFQK